MFAPVALGLFGLEASTARDYRNRDGPIRAIRTSRSVSFLLPHRSNLGLHGRLIAGKARCMLVGP